MKTAANTGKTAPSSPISTETKKIPEEIPSYFKKLEKEDFEKMFKQYYTNETSPTTFFMFGKYWRSNAITVENVHKYALGEGKDRITAKAYSAMISDFNSNGFYKGETKEGRAHGRGKHTHPNGDVYQGEFQNGLPNGNGKITYTNGDVFEGKFQNGYFKSGKGKKSYPNGNVYEGDFQNGLPNGNGKITYTNGDVYEGQFENGNPKGNGTKVYANGYIYEGDFQNGLPNGKGTLTLTNGDVYEGKFQNGYFKSGKGKKSYPNGNVYQGELKNDSAHGIGKCIEPDGSTSDGLWENGYFKSGKVKRTFSNGDIYEGEMKEGRPNGNGKVTRPDGTCYEGDFQNGFLNGKGKSSNPDGSCYEGAYQNGLPHGPGKIQYKNGDLFEGLWQNGKPNGFGTKTLRNGNVFEGNWENGKPNGFGTETLRNGNVFEGNWENGIFKSGMVKINYLNGSYYKGKWFFNEIVGKGILTDKNGKAYEANWTKALNALPQPDEMNPQELALRSNDMNLIYSIFDPLKNEEDKKILEEKTFQLQDEIKIAGQFFAEGKTELCHYILAKLKNKGSELISLIPVALEEGPEEFVRFLIESLKKKNPSAIEDNLQAIINDALENKQTKNLNFLVKNNLMKEVDFKTAILSYFQAKAKEKGLEINSTKELISSFLTKQNAQDFNFIFSGNVLSLLGVNINEISLTPLIANYNSSEDKITEGFLQQLIFLGADISVPDEEGFTPLMSAINKKHISCANILVQQMIGTHIQNRNSVLPQKTLNSLNALWKDSISNGSSVSISKSEFLTLVIKNTTLLSDIEYLKSLPDFDTDELKNGLALRKNELETATINQNNLNAVLGRHVGNEIHGFAQTGITDSLVTVKNVLPLNFNHLTIKTSETRGEFYHLIQTVFKEDKLRAQKCLNILEHVIKNNQGRTAPLCSKILNLIKPMTQLIIGYAGNDWEKESNPKEINEKALDRVKLWLEFSLVEANLDDNSISCFEGILERFGTTSINALSEVSDAFFKANACFVATGAHVIPWPQILLENKNIEKLAEKLKDTSLEITSENEIKNEEGKQAFAKACIEVVLEGIQESLYKTIDDTPYLTENDKTKLKTKAYSDLVNHPKTLNYINSNYSYFNMGDEPNIVPALLEKISLLYS